MAEKASLARLSIIPLSYFTVSALLWKAVRTPKTNDLHGLLTWASIIFVLVFPIIYGRSNYVLLDILLPIGGFTWSMRIYEIMLIRPTSETLLWSKSTFWSYMVAFPLDDVDPTPELKKPEDRIAAARWHSFTKALQCVCKIMIANFMVTFIPWSEELAKLQFFSVPYLLYYFIVSCTLYFGLSGSTELGFALIGLVFGVWMKDMFDNPLISATPRDFWSKRWNLAIKDLFHKVLFSIGQSFLDPSAKHKTDGDKPAKKSLKPSSSLQAILAFGVFVFSGLMHEYILYCSFGILSGENMLYFILNGIACFVQVSLEHKYPSIRALPRALKTAFTSIFFLLVGPFFSEPYMRAGVFDMMKRNRLFPMPMHDVRLFG